ncbi:hypothetical protein ACT4R9_11375 [Ornithobacterium rhinotracheale]|uniref:hypothetical protein n=1 Tax=Ornithobacterium rhinotracheale TaxID=28251 RepID=UPI003FA4A5AA
MKFFSDLMNKSKLLALLLIAFIVWMLVRRFNSVVTAVKEKMEEAKPLILKEKTTDQFVKTNFRFGSELFKTFFLGGAFDPYYVTNGVRKIKTPFEYGKDLGESLVGNKAKPKSNNQPKRMAPKPKPKLHPEWQKVLDKFNNSLNGK